MRRQKCFAGAVLGRSPGRDEEFRSHRVRSRCAWRLVALARGRHSRRPFNPYPPAQAAAPGLPQGAVQGENDFGDASYGGACPPPGSGQHHYEITVWALPTETVPSGAKLDDMVSFLKSHAIAQAKLVAVYER